MDCRSMITFEQGPIRPPSEAGSLLLRFSRNCPWNRCTFCPVYKGQKFSRRSLREILEDIDSVSAIIRDLERQSHAMGFGGKMTQSLLSAVLKDPAYGSAYHYVAYWHIGGNGRVFIQDANSLILPDDVLIEALQYLRRNVPGIQRVTSYGRSSTLARKSREQLAALHTAGLDRIHIGLESGSPQVLRFVMKGATPEEHVAAGTKVKDAGITLSEYVMPGLGGKRWSHEHATETARVLNAIDPHFIRLRSLRIPPSTPLYRDVAEGRFTPLSDDETAEEILLFLQSLQGIHSHLTSDHIMNLLPEVQGTLPQDRDAMMATVEKYLALPREERLLYRLGRRGGALHALADIQNPTVRARLEAARRDLETQWGGDLEQLITELGDRYI